MFLVDRVCSANIDLRILTSQYTLKIRGLFLSSSYKKYTPDEFFISENIKENYFEESMYLDVEGERLAKMNVAMAAKIAQLREQIEIKFFASSSYD